MSDVWRWLISNASLPYRIAAGVAILATLAVIELAQKGRAARRWREYLFLCLVVLIAMVYGVVNDQVTSRISWEYYYYGKELAPVLGTRVPPDEARLSWEAAKIGMMATWSVGLLVGVALLFVNNPNRRWASLSYRRLIGVALWVVVFASLGGVAVGFVGSRGWLAVMSSDFAEMLRNNEMRPLRFMTAYGVHLGGYIGGLVGTVWAVMKLHRLRVNRSLAKAATPSA